MVGYVGDGGRYHEDVECELLIGTVKRIPESKALKFGFDYCPECIS